MKGFKGSFDGSSFKKVFDNLLRLTAEIIIIIVITPRL